MDLAPKGFERNIPVEFTENTGISVRVSKQTEVTRQGNESTVHRKRISVGN